MDKAGVSYVQAPADYTREVAEAIKSADNGTGHSKEQAFAWLDSWTSGNKLPLPSPDILPAK
jgi:hypothetical protein